MSPLEELATLLKPAGGGLYLVSTGVAEQKALQEKVYGVTSAEAIAQRFQDNLARIARAKVLILGIPSDVGAGFQRGANLGPQALRLGLLERDPTFFARHGASPGSEHVDVVDIGDVFVVPQLLHDGMLSEGQRHASQDALYPHLSEEVRRALPVASLSIAERALGLALTLNPDIQPLVLGGDHSTAWPIVSALAEARDRRGLAPFGIVQVDAHTDLLDHRLGIPYCFATWSYHANERIGRGGRFVQLGIRASRRDKAFWESTLGVRQFWAKECLAAPEATLDAVVSQLQQAGVRSVYISNDVDGTDARWIDATGTPEPGGLEPPFVHALLKRLGQEFHLLGADVMELAPNLRPKPDSAERSIGIAVDYLQTSLEALLHCRPGSTTTSSSTP